LHELTEHFVNCLSVLCSMCSSCSSLSRYQLSHRADVQTQRRRYAGRRFRPKAALAQSPVGCLASNLLPGCSRRTPVFAVGTTTPRQEHCCSHGCIGYMAGSTKSTATPSNGDPKDGLGSLDVLASLKTVLLTPSLKARRDRHGVPQSGLSREGDLGKRQSEQMWQSGHVRWFVGTYPH
jgi:hypothetical protein